ncbi:hypothetical protein [Paraliomyxa miuraensis]|uniref:hypothetical protein n=1 Tax=Paraliomyxa miuraensis TaxID=376150 RepID=UPI00224E5F33|nr:hypothetical protein [Paraliomyxa miuraensis]MCX4244806.1 hypothetical protein [Paraliomyxa miuraensis]
MAANIEEKTKTMAKKTPLQLVKEKYGSKAQLIDAVASLVDRDDGESEDEHKKRLKYVSNAKLLHLVALAEKAKALGGRDGMIAKILELKGQTKDHEYRDKLKKLSLGRLVDMTK